MGDLRIGVVSDTHNFLDPAVHKHFAGVNHILHGGDIGRPAILHALETIAPVTAVCGNTDDLAFGYPQTEVIELGSRKFLLHHIVNPHSPGETVARLIARHRPDVVVFGHTHRPFCETISGVLFFNPGYAGAQRFSLQRSVGLLHCGSAGISTEFIELDAC